LRAGGAHIRTTPDALTFVRERLRRLLDNKRAAEYCGLSSHLRESLARLGAAAQSSEDHDAYRQISQEFEEFALQIAWLSRNQRALDERLDGIEHSLLFRIIRWPGARYVQIRNWLSSWLLRAGPEYQEWIRYEQQTLYPGSEEGLRQVSGFAQRPLISVVIAAHEARPAWLIEAIKSISGQIYSGWELCIYADQAIDPAVTSYLSQLSRAGAAIRVVQSAGWSGKSAALNAACSAATGDYVGFVDQHDVLSPYALFYVAQALQRVRPALLYSDEDGLSADGRRYNPLFKPAWSPDLLISTMYLSHFLVVSRAAFDALGGFRSAYDGSRELDLCLRLTESSEPVIHIPRILYHQRQDPDSGHLPSVDAVVIADAIERRKWNAKVAEGLSRDTFRIERATNRLISIIICSRSPKLLENVLRSIRKKTIYPRYEVIVAEHCPHGKNPEMARLATEYGCVQISIQGPFNFSTINNKASEHANGEILAFLNDDVEPLRSDWLSNLCGPLELEEIGVVGAKLLYPSGAVQHAGVVVGIGDGAGHVNRNRYRGVYWKWIDQTRNVSAVTGACLAIRLEAFRRLNGFDPIFPENYNDVDLCLRVREAGYRIVYEPTALLRHYEGQTRRLIVRYDERERFYSRWRRSIESSDPGYNPNLSLGENALLNFAGLNRNLDAR
jgi:GT2 family glycosyltransferase